MKCGYWGRVLRVNLTDQSYKVDEISEEVWKKFLGGSGFGAKVILEETPPKIDPLSPENKIIFGIGSWQSVKASGNAKWSVVTKSPLTKTFLDSAGSGHWAPQFKGTGYDALIIEGKSEKTIYLYITEEGVEFRDASHLWGKDTIDTTEVIKGELGNKRISILNIGPSGEIYHPVACITCDGHSFAGRGGSGAVMGSKNLKAIAAYGKKDVPVFDPDKAKKKALELMKLLANQGASCTRDGTPQVVNPCQEAGDLPMKYWMQDTWPDAWKISAPHYTEVLKAKPRYCANCPLGCHRHVTVDEPAEYAMEGNGPEYETLAMMGGNILCSDLAAICKANDICNRMGCDTISVGAWIGFLAECWEKGLITEKDTDGVKVEWGNGKMLVALTEKITKMVGVGAWFKEGIQGAAKRMGPEAQDLIVHVKNMDYPAHDPRCWLGLGVNYATGTRGACHMRGCTMDPYYPEIHPKMGLKELPTSLDHLPQHVFVTQNVSSIFNQLTICFFMTGFAGMTLTQLLELHNAITGWDWTPDDLFSAGSRAFTLQRLINVRDGFDRKDDTLPKKMTVAAKEGGRKGKVPILHDKILKEYYRLRKWDDNGRLTKESLLSVGLEEYDDYLVH